MLLEAVAYDTICKVQVLPLQKWLLRPSATDHPWLDPYTQFTLQCTRYSRPKCIAHNVLSLPSLPFGLHWAIQCNCTTWLHSMFGILTAYSFLVTGALAKPFKGLSWYSLRWWCWSILWRSYCFDNANPMSCNTNQTTHDQAWLMQYLWEMDHGISIQSSDLASLDPRLLEEHTNEERNIPYHPWTMGMSIKAPAISTLTSNHAMRKTRVITRGQQVNTWLCNSPQRYLRLASLDYYKSGWHTRQALKGATEWKKEMGEDLRFRWKPCTCNSFTN
jgi:hypothetical protein